eukprot:1317486-Rhodomonas_salina.1
MIASRDLSRDLGRVLVPPNIPLIHPSNDPRKQDDRSYFGLEVPSRLACIPVRLYYDHTYQHSPAHVQHCRTWDRYRWGHQSGYRVTLLAGQCDTTRTLQEDTKNSSGWIVE